MSGCLLPFEEWLIGDGPAINYAKFTAVNVNNLENSRLWASGRGESVQTLSAINHQTPTQVSDGPRVRH